MNRSAPLLMSRRVTGWLAGAGLALGVLATADRASACGGLFCSSANPVNQMAERIIFASDGDGNVICAVQILYEGPSTSFSWVLPVPAHSADEIGVSISSDVAFQRLQQASNPVYQLQTAPNSGCGVGRGTPLADGANFSGSGPAAEDAISVVASGTTGPYDWELIDIPATLPDPTDAAITWLTDNGYDEPPNGRETLKPYLEDGLGLIAFRLTKSATTGSIRPVILEYPASRPTIPIRPTAVAAADDMGVMVWVLGGSRAVATNYRTLELNETLIDWFNPQSTYNDVVIEAANEAGGQGFVTEQSGAAGQFAQIIWRDSERDQAAMLSQAESVPALLVEAAQSFGYLDGFTDAMREGGVALRTPVTPEEFVSCPSCYYQDVGIDPYAANTDPTLDPSLGTDSATFLVALSEYVIEPMAATRRLFEDYSHVTRMYTTLSADEMTRDPEFDFNPELEDVDNVHVAEQTLSCLMDGDNPWTIELPSGYVIHGTGTDWPNRVGDMPANVRVVQLATTGAGEVIEDNREIIRDHLGSDGGGCGCRVAGRRPSGAPVLLAGLGLLAFAGRRRSQ